MKILKDLLMAPKRNFLSEVKSNMAKVTVLGSGGWGTALAISAFNCGHEVSLWSPFEQEVSALIKNRENIKLLPGIKIPDEINITSDINCADGSLISVIACPSVAVRSVANGLAKIENHGIVVNVAKGFEKDTHLYNIVHKLTPHEFEIWCSEYLSKLGFTNILLLPIGPDGGKDIIYEMVI